MNHRIFERILRSSLRARARLPQGHEHLTPPTPGGVDLAVSAGGLEPLGGSAEVQKTKQAAGLPYLGGPRRAPVDDPRVVLARV